jgi:hypothetical protein
MQGKVPDSRADIRELMDLLAGLIDAVRKLPPGSERAHAIEEIWGYQHRLDALLKRNEFLKGQVMSPARA